VHRPLLEAASALTAEVARLIFGTEDLVRVTDALSGWTRRELGAGIDVVERWHWSVGAVALVGLDDGRRVVLKSFPPRWTAPFLRSVVTVQRHLCDRGLPCARPLAGPAPLAAAAMVCAEEVVDDPGQPPHPFGEAELAASAAGLARLVTVAAELPRSAVAPLAMHPLATPVDGLYPEPHSPLFDFEATAAGAEWIDELARVAIVARDSDRTEPVVAHTDWSARNVRVWPDGIRAIYDADSLALVAESTAAGIAAATWSAFGEASERIAPSPHEAAQWVAAYGQADRPLSRVQRHAAGGSVLYSLAYTARCEHAVEMLHPELGRPRRARDRLEIDGPTFLDRFDEASRARRSL
jgi:hypothetical protein